MQTYSKCFPKKLIVHHTAGSEYQTFEDINHFHRVTKDDYGNYKYHYGVPTSLGYYCAYNYVIDYYGNLTKCRQDDERGAHTIGQNDVSIGICLIGNFDNTLPSKAQTQVLITLMRDLMAKYRISPYQIYPHRAFANKSCFGKRLHDTWASDLVNEDPVVIEQLKHQIRILTEKLKALLLRR